MTLTSAPKSNTDTSRSVPTATAKLIRAAHTPRDLDFNPQIADLMLAIRAGRPTVISRSSARTRTGQRQASLSWKTDRGTWNRFQSDEGRFYCEPFTPGTHATDLDTDEPWSHLVDKLLDAITHNWHVHTYLLDNVAVLSWDRASHGNTPTVILHPDDTLHDFYNWPEYLPEHLEPRNTPVTPARAFQDNVKTAFRSPARNHPYTQETIFKDPKSLLPPCQIFPCPNAADYNALDPRGYDHGPLCNYHLYGPTGYVQDRRPFEEFRTWLSRTNHLIALMTPLALHAETERARRWTGHQQGP